MCFLEGGAEMVGRKDSKMINLEEVKVYLLKV
jgi:hypothetical protein